jgi:hypothetical protein
MRRLVRWPPGRAARVYPWRARPGGRAGPDGELLGIGPAGWTYCRRALRRRALRRRPLRRRVLHRRVLHRQALCWQGLCRRPVCRRPVCRRSRRRGKGRNRPGGRTWSFLAGRPRRVRIRPGGARNPRVSWRLTQLGPTPGGRSPARWRRFGPGRRDPVGAGLVGQRVGSTVPGGPRTLGALPPHRRTLRCGVRSAPTDACHCPPLRYLRRRRARSTSLAASRSARSWRLS